MKQQQPHNIACRIVAETDTGTVDTLATSDNLGKLARRVQRDADTWRALGWSGFELQTEIVDEDGSPVFVTALTEELRGYLLRGEVATEEAGILAPLTF